MLALFLLPLLWTLWQRYNILADIWNTLSGIPNDLVSAVGAIWKAIKAIFHGAENVFKAVYDAWEWCYNGIVWLGETAAGFAGDIVSAAEWVITKGIPDAADFAIGWAWNAIKDAADTVEHLAAEALHRAVNFLHDLIHDVENVLTHALHIITGVVNTVVDWIEGAGKWLYDVVSHPEKLVAWIWDHIISKLLSDLWFVLEQIAGFLWAQIRKDASAFFHAVEDVVSVIL